MPAIKARALLEHETCLMRLGITGLLAAIARPDFSQAAQRSSHYLRYLCHSRPHLYYKRDQESHKRRRATLKLKELLGAP